LQLFLYHFRDIIRGGVLGAVRSTAVHHIFRTGACVRRRGGGACTVASTSLDIISYFPKFKEVTRLVPHPFRVGLSSFG